MISLKVLLQLEYFGGPIVLVQCKLANVLFEAIINSSNWVTVL